MQPCCLHSVRVGSSWRMHASQHQCEPRRCTTTIMTRGLHNAAQKRFGCCENRQKHRSNERSSGALLLRGGLRFLVLFSGVLRHTFLRF